MAEKILVICWASLHISSKQQSFGCSVYYWKRGGKWLSDYRIAVSLPGTANPMEQYQSSLGVAEAALDPTCLHFPWAFLGIMLHKQNIFFQYIIRILSSQKFLGRLLGEVIINVQCPILIGRRWAKWTFSNLGKAEATLYPPAYKP